MARLNLTKDNLEDLQTMDWNTLESASQAAMQETAEQYQIPAPLSDGYAMEWGPVVDGDYLPSNPVTEDSFAENGRDVTLLIGTNLNEWTGMTGGQSAMTEEAEAAYRDAYPNEDPETANLVDTLIRMPSLKIMAHKANQKGANVYAYVFTWNEGRMGAYHGAEIPFIFRHTQGGMEKLQDQVSGAWVHFAKTGVPAADGLPDWEPYTREGGATMLLDETSSLVYNHDEALMAIMEPDYEY